MPIRYYTVNDRPVQIVPTAEGGADILVLDMRTGAFMPDRSYFLRVSEVGKDVDALDAATFEAAVAQIRAAIVARRMEEPIRWQRTGAGEFPYEARLDGHRHVIRVNDFPAEPLYTLLVEDQPLADLEDWPLAWTK